MHIIFIWNLKCVYVTLNKLNNNNSGLNSAVFHQAVLLLRRCGNRGYKIFIVNIYAFVSNPTILIFPKVNQHLLEELSLWIELQFFFFLEGEGGGGS